MARRKHFWGRSPLPHNGGPKLWRMILFLFVLGMIYTQSRQAANWAWLARTAQAQQPAAVESPPPAAGAASEGENPAKPAASDPAASDIPAGTDNPAAPDKPADKPARSWETIKERPTDKEQWDEKAIKDSLSAVTDKTAIQESEMPAYWNLMRWTLAQSSFQLEERAAKNVTMNDLWTTPGDYRGKLVRMPLHIRRISRFEAKGENSAGVKTGYEIWGWADHSHSLPFAVIVPDLPPGLAVGEDVAEDGVFSGYFFKWMRYTPGVGKERSSPVLIGRIVAQPKKVMKSPSVSNDPLFVWLGVAGGLAVAGMVIWSRFSSRRTGPVVSLPKDEETAMAFLSRALEPDGASPSRRENETAASRND